MGVRRAHPCLTCGAMAGDVHTDATHTVLPSLRVRGYGEHGSKRQSAGMREKGESRKKGLDHGIGHLVAMTIPAHQRLDPTEG